ncbi:hypothetical protein GCM10017714_24790 [Curtobacterium pusillum]|nr:hypothetical protein GCM10017610_28950 [Curtobacterium pusillum]
MPQIIETVDVTVPVRQAYDQWTRFEEFPLFLDEVEKIVQVDDTTTDWTVKVAGQEREFRAVITEQHPDERVAWTVKDGETEHAGVVTFHKLSETETRVTAQIDWAPSGILEKLGSAVGVGGHAVKKDLQNYKERVEAAPTDAGWRGEVQDGQPVTQTPNTPDTTHGTGSGRHAQQGSLADLNDETAGHAFDQTNGMADGLAGDSDGTADSDATSVAERDDRL